MRLPRTSRLSLLASLAATALVIAGTVGSWARAGGEAIPGIHADAGVIVLMSVVFGTAILVWRMLAPEGLRGFAGALFATCAATFAATGLGAAVYALSSPASAVDRSSADAQWGLYLSVVGAVVLVAAVLPVFAKHRPTGDAVAVSRREVRMPVEALVGILALYLVALGPAAFGSYWVSAILTQTFLFGIAAASLTFLSAYGGMVSLSQSALLAISAIVLGNIVTKGGPGGTSKGLHLGWDPTLGLVLAIVMTTALGILFGAVAARSAGIYFLMITLTYAVIVTYFLGQVTLISGFSGIGGIGLYTPGWVGNLLNHPNKLYYIALGVAFFTYVLIRYVIRTPFGIALQGVRDEPVRMSSLGYNVPLHRTLAFGFSAFLASLAGILYAWWAGQVSPGDADIPATLNLLVMAVIGGLVRIEGAWIGAFTFIVLQNYVRDFSVPGLSFGGTLFGGSFNTLIGVIFLAIVVVSPDGLLGIWERLSMATKLGAAGGARLAARRRATQKGG